MAITSTLSPDFLIPAHNEIPITFSSSIIQSTSAIGEIVLDGAYTFRYSPNSAGEFYCNIKQAIKTLVNSSAFEDNNDYCNLGYYNIVAQSSFIKKISIKYTVSLVNTSDTVTVDYYFYNGVMQAENWEQLTMPVSSSKILHAQNNNGYSFDYNQGLPFDLSFYSNADSFQVVNQTTGSFTQNIAIPSPGFRIVFCDGMEDLSTTNVLQLTDGVNKLQLITYTNNTIADSIFFNVSKNDCSNGIYLKWLNQHGGWNFWKFEPFYNEVLDIKSSGNIENMPLINEYNYSPSIQLGSSISRSFTILSGIIRQDLVSYFKSIFYSPKIYFYNGQAFSRKNVTKWISVTIEDKFNLVTRGNDYTSYSIDLKLPDPIMQSI